MQAAEGASLLQQTQASLVAAEEAFVENKDLFHRYLGLYSGHQARAAAAVTAMHLQWDAARNASGRPGVAQAAASSEGWL